LSEHGLPLPGERRREKERETERPRQRTILIMQSTDIKLLRSEQKKIEEQDKMKRKGEKVTR
jgi:hypothetical protein